MNALYQFFSKNFVQEMISKVKKKSWFYSSTWRSTKVNQIEIRASTPSSQFISRASVKSLPLPTSRPRPPSDMSITPPFPHHLLVSQKWAIDHLPKEGGEGQSAHVCNFTWVCCACMNAVVEVRSPLDALRPRIINGLYLFFFFPLTRMTRAHLPSYEVCELWSVRPFVFQG